MSLLKLIVIKKVQVQNANAVAGFVHSTISQTQTLGFTHALSRQVSKSNEKICFKACATVMHSQHVHTFKHDTGATKFTQSRNSPYLYSTPSAKKSATAPVIEEGKMNATLSLIIAYEGDIDDSEGFCEWLLSRCMMNKLGGGTILAIDDVSEHTFESTSKTNKQIKYLIRSLLPGFVLYDRSDLLAEHLAETQPHANNFNHIVTAWMDFITLKQTARPLHHLIDKHLEKFANDSENALLNDIWQKHLKQPYTAIDIPEAIIEHFQGLSIDSENAKKSERKKLKPLLQQWHDYLEPSKKTKAEWAYKPKPAKGYLVPYMCGYKAVTHVLENEQVKNTRDSYTDVCFAEAVHSIGEWRGIHRIKSFKDLLNALWCYEYEQHWYLCKQNYQPTLDVNTDNPY